MKKLFLYLLSAMMIFAVGCEGFDDSLLWEEINSLKDRVTALEQLCRQMNTNISSLQTIVDALQNKDYVTNISPITEDGKVIGYTITFSKSGSITIYHGKDGTDGKDGADGQDGKDGYTPVIGIAKDTDGLYYWTLDGDWLLDSDGNKVKAVGVDGKDGADGKDGENGTNGEDGTDGKDGVTPKLKIENGYWYVSYDNGTTWTELGKATGENGADGEDGADGDSMFKEITYDNEYVYIILSDGSTLTIPRYIAPKPSSNQIWYTNGSTTEATNPNNPNAFGVNIISNQYDADKGFWIITFDGDVTSIRGSSYAAGAFHGCSSLTSVTIPDSVTLIGDYAFRSCSSLTSITISESVTSIGDSAFSYCSSLTSITIPDGVTSIGDSTFIGCSSLTDMTIPESVKSIGDACFNYCTNLSSITILGKNVQLLGQGIFCACDNLKSFDCDYASSDGRCLVVNGKLRAFAPAGLDEYIFPNNITTIGSWSICFNAKFESITLPESITTIEDYAISYNYNSSILFELKTLYCKAATPPACSSRNIIGVEKIYVPTAAVDAYKTANGWKDYADKIEGYTF